MLYTLNEAAFLSSQPLSAINRSIDRGPCGATLSRNTGRGRRLLPLAEVRFLAIEHEVRGNLSASAKERLHGIVIASDPPPSRVSLDCLEIDLSGANDRVERRLQDLERLKRAVDGRGKDPVLTGTDIPAHAVASLVHTSGRAAAQDAFPALTAAQVDTAVAYASIYPKVGRPFPGHSFKSHLASLAEAGVWDLEETGSAEMVAASTEAV